MRVLGRHRQNECTRIAAVPAQHSCLPPDASVQGSTAHDWYAASVPASGAAGMQPCGAAGYRALLGDGVNPWEARHLHGVHAAMQKEFVRCI